ncbi:hypothetical protein EKO23_17770 [Nocardioides guangzhouensis]|uniref:FUSC family protein n=1 Tax=Nocardioides guangzhouensis TaxID=2497878 RepID=A0A4Q4Z8Y4_9ACTN|nr:aromatic acid exporter family protein [Nocardioides guangzhouensis]RYP83925.1 hypothetical protein EKO23_17770 [Nocardioides guangzhouensis]
MREGLGGRLSARWRDGLRDPVLLTDLLQSAKTALAGVLAWVVATEVLALRQPFLAPWAAVLVVHATLYRTFSRAAQQVAATVLAVVLAWGSGQLFGLGAAGMGVMLAIAFLLGRGRWLREETTTLATTGIVVLATNAIDQSNLLWGRLLDTSTGIVVGLLVNLVVWPPLRHRAAWARARGIPEELVAVLREMADHLGPELEEDQVEEWIRRAGLVDQHVDEAWAFWRQAHEGGRFNPRRRRRTDLDELQRTLHWLEQAVADVQSMGRTLAMSARHATLWDDAFRRRWTALVVEAADAVESGKVSRLHAVGDDLGELVRDLSDDALAHSAWQEYGGMVVALRNVLSALSRAAPTLASGTAP